MAVSERRTGDSTCRGLGRLFAGGFLPSSERSANTLPRGLVDPSRQYQLVALGSGCRRLPHYCPIQRSRNISLGRGTIASRNSPPGCPGGTWPFGRASRRAPATCPIRRLSPTRAGTGGANPGSGMKSKGSTQTLGFLAAVVLRHYTSNTHKHDVFLGTRRVPATYNGCA